MRKLKLVGILAVLIFVAIPIGGLGFLCEKIGRWADLKFHRLMLWEERVYPRPLRDYEAGS